MSGPLAARVDRLERASRRDRALAMGILALALTTAQSPTASPLIVRGAGSAAATVSGSGITVRDASGIVRVNAGLDADGYPSIDLYDRAGTLRQSMYLLNDRPVLRLFDPSGKRRAELFLGSDTGSGEFVIRDASDVTRLAAFIGSRGLPELAVYGTDAKVRAYLATDDTSPYLVMKDRSETTRVAIGGYDSGRFGLDVRNAAGNAVWSRP